MAVEPGGHRRMEQGLRYHDRMRGGRNAPFKRPCGTAQDGRQVLRSYGVLCGEFKAHDACVAGCAGGAETPEKLTTLKAAVRHRAYFPRVRVEPLALNQAVAAGWLLGMRHEPCGIFWRFRCLPKNVFLR